MNIGARLPYCGCIRCVRSASWAVLYMWAMRYTWAMWAVWAMWYMWAMWYTLYATAAAWPRGALQWIGAFTMWFGPM